MPIPADIFQIWAALFGNANPPVPAQNLYAANFNTSGLIYESFVDNITANAGGGQSGAYKITSEVSRITTVANSGDSVILPASVSGMSLTIINATATNAMNLFPNGTDQINALGASAAFSVAAGKTVEAYCVTAGQWHTILSA